MKESFYKKLQDDFAAFCSLQNEDSYDQLKYGATIISIKEARKKISMHSAPAEKEILIYCIDTLFELLDEGNKQKISDFADAACNIPEIYMNNRNLYSLRKKLKAFQRKYGENYFYFMDKVKPHFSTKAPRNKWDYFSAASDEDFRKLHPEWYKLLRFIGIAVLMLPQIVYMLYCFLINPAPEDWAIVLGYIGTFVIGIGLFNIVAAWMHQYLGHILTVVCLAGGAALTLISMQALYA